MQVKGISKPRLAVVTPFFPLGTRPHQGRSTYQMLVALRERFEITVICPIPDYPRWLAPRRFDYRRVDVNYRVPQLDVQDGAASLVLFIRNTSGQQHQPGQSAECQPSQSLLRNKHLRLLCNLRL